MTPAAAGPGLPGRPVRPLVRPGRHPPRVLLPAPGPLPPGLPLPAHVAGRPGRGDPHRGRRLAGGAVGPAAVGELGGDRRRADLGGVRHPSVWLPASSPRARAPALRAAGGDPRRAGRGRARGRRLAERQRLARDIHDTLAQGRQHRPASSGRGRAAGGRDEARNHLERARRTARTTWPRPAAGLGPAPGALSAAPLGEALGRLAGRVAEETGLAATATVTGTPQPLSADTEVTLLRVTQEALANVTRTPAAGGRDPVLHGRRGRPGRARRRRRVRPHGRRPRPQRRARAARHARAGRGLSAAGWRGEPPGQAPASP